MTTTEAAAHLGLTRAWLWRLIKSGTIKAEKRGRDWWIEAEEVERYKRERRPAHRPANVATNVLTRDGAVNPPQPNAKEQP